MHNLKRKRGAQPGNQNARKHGYYAAHLDPQGRLDLKQASSLEGIDEEVALLRSQIIKASRSGDYRAISPLLKALTVLEKLQDIKNKQDSNRQERVLRAVLYLGRILYDGWLNSGYPVTEDIKNLNELKQIVPSVSKGVGATGTKLASASLV
jgi:hypothetical protein